MSLLQLLQLCVPSLDALCLVPSRCTCLVPHTLGIRFCCLYQRVQGQSKGAQASCAEIWPAHLCEVFIVHTSSVAPCRAERCHGSTCAVKAQGVTWQQANAGTTSCMLKLSIYSAPAPALVLIEQQGRAVTPPASAQAVPWQPHTHPLVPSTAQQRSQRCSGAPPGLHVCWPVLLQRPAQPHKVQAGLQLGKHCCKLNMAWCLAVMP